MSTSRPKLLFLVSVDWFFCSHFLPRAVAAKNAGYDVIVLTKVTQHSNRIEAAGLRLIPIEIDRRSLNPIAALKTLFCISSIYRKEKPKLVHHIALKPILLGSLAARFSKVLNIVNAFVGGGYILTSTNKTQRIVRPILNLALSGLLNPNGSKVVFENSDDLSTYVIKKQVRSKDAVLIRGAGVDPTHYIPASFTSETPIVLVAARLLWDKGIGEFVEAARTLRAKGIKARFVIVGDSDPENRAAIEESTLTTWRNEEAVELWGFRIDMPDILSQASIACLPSYREGLPKALLEAMAAGLPCITTDVPGCREAVRHGDNGLLVPPRDSQALADALNMLINNPAMQKRMGARGRERVYSEFSSELVIEQTLALYNDFINE